MNDAAKLVQSALIGDVVEGLGLAVFVSDDDLRYLAVNEAAANLLGYTRDELLALRVSDVVDGTPAKLRRRAREAEQEGGRAGAALLRHRDGSAISVRYVTLGTSIAGRLPVLLTFATDGESEFLDRLAAKLEPEARRPESARKRRTSARR
ncbi:MAG: hypothetical protein QOE36_1365 [Gaiellaceae bacterium]|jgi:PAS domain S-box-containing protein|nr:hypothetical protein [Gaiellaceae bacterium]